MSKDNLADKESDGLADASSAPREVSMSRIRFRQILAVQTATFVVAEGTNMAVRHYLPLMHRYWVLSPVVYLRYAEHIQYGFIGFSGMSGRLVFAGFCLAFMLGLCVIYLHDLHRDPTVTLAIGVLLGATAVNGYEILAFGSATDFLGLRLPFGSINANLPDLGLGLGLSCMLVVWVRPKWTQPRWRLLGIVALGSFLFLLNPIGLLRGSPYPPGGVSSAQASSTVQAEAAKSWGKGLRVAAVFTVSRCLLFGSNCRQDTAWLWEVDLEGKGRFTWSDNRTTDGADGFVEYESGRFLGFTIP